MTKTGRFLAAMTAATLMLSAAVPSAFGQFEYPGYVPSFPTPGPALGVGPEGGPANWLGGDASFSCPLDAERSYWSFADVYIAAPGIVDRHQSANHLLGLSTGNTIAIATCRDGKFEVQHYYRGSAEHPYPFFLDLNNPTNDPTGTRLWLRKALMIAGHLYIFAKQVNNTGGVFNTQIIRVLNPLDAPPHWHYDYLNLGIFPAPKPRQVGTTAPAPINFGNEAYLDPEGNYLFVYGMQVDNSSPKNFIANFRITALRIPLGVLKDAKAGSDLGPACQSLSNTPGKWRDGLHHPSDFHDVNIPAFNGFSTRYNAALKAWQVVFCDDRALFDYYNGLRTFGDPLVNSASIMTGPTAWGPWSTPKALARYPEMDPRRPPIAGRPRGMDCYAYFTAEQPAFETGDREVVFSYTIGSYTQRRYHDDRFVLGDSELYNVYTWATAHPSFGPPPASPPGR